MMTNEDDVWTNIEHSIGSGFRIESKSSVSGGCINKAFKIHGGNQQYFVKINTTEFIEMFNSEAEGLKEISASNTVRVPTPKVSGKSKQCSFLIMEYLCLNNFSATSSAALGEQLAAMHRNPHEYYGWLQNNTIGSTPQLNDPEQDWVTFWRNNRLQPQLNLAITNGIHGDWIDDGFMLSEKLAALFSNYTPEKSLLHGDLWAGNSATDDCGHPVIFDPACYYGDRECDLAMSELFGGFDDAFYRAYHHAYPLDQGYSVRKTLYNLYHILNHLNLFGDSYLKQSQSMIQKLLSELT